MTMETDYERGYRAGVEAAAEAIRLQRNDPNKFPPPARECERIVMALLPAAPSPTHAMALVKGGYKCEKCGMAFPSAEAQPGYERCDAPEPKA